MGVTPEQVEVLYPVNAKKGNKILHRIAFTYSNLKLAYLNSVNTTPGRAGAARAASQ